MQASDAAAIAGRIHSEGTPSAETISTVVPSSSGSAPTIDSMRARSSTAGRVASSRVVAVVCPMRSTTIANMSLAMSVVRDADRLLRAEANGFLDLGAQ